MQKNMPLDHYNATGDPVSYRMTILNDRATAACSSGCFVSWCGLFFRSPLANLQVHPRAAILGERTEYVVLCRRFLLVYYSEE